MNSKTKNILSLISNVAIFVLMVYAISRYFTKGGDGNMGVYGVASLRYFTNLSNIFAGLGSLVMIPYNVANLRSGENNYPKWAFALKFVSTISVTVTFLTCVFFLGPIQIITWAPFGVDPINAYLFLFKGNVFFLHFLIPLLSILSVVLLERCESFSKKDSSWGLAPTVLYSFVYFYMVVCVGSANGGWIDFYSFTFGGHLWAIPISAGVMYYASWLLSRLEWKLNNKVNEKHIEKE